MGAFVGCCVIAGVILYATGHFIDDYCKPALDALERIADVIANEDENTEGEGE